MEHSISPLPNNGAYSIVPLPTVEYSIVPLPSTEPFNYSGECSWKASTSGSIKQCCGQSNGLAQACFVGVRQVHGCHHDPLGSFWNFLNKRFSITYWIFSFCQPSKVDKNGLSIVDTIIDMSSVCMHAKLLQSCPTLWDPVDCNPPASSALGILQARILEWVAMLSSRGSSWPRDQTCISYVSCIGRRLFTTGATWICHSWEEAEQNTLISDVYSVNSGYKAEWVPSLSSGSSHSQILSWCTSLDIHQERIIWVIANCLGNWVELHSAWRVGNGCLEVTIHVGLEKWEAFWERQKTRKNTSGQREEHKHIVHVPSRGWCKGVAGMF